MENWDWPQGVAAGMASVTVIGGVTLHGKPRGPYDGRMMWLDAAVFVVVLTAGGFWS